MNQNLLRQARKLQEQLAKIQEDLGHETVTGTAGSGAVEVTLNGHGHAQRIKIAPRAVDCKRHRDAGRSHRHRIQRCSSQSCRAFSIADGSAGRWSRTSRAVRNVGLSRTSSLGADWRTREASHHRPEDCRAPSVLFAFGFEGRCRSAQPRNFGRQREGAILQPVLFAHRSRSVQHLQRCATRSDPALRGR